MDQILSLSTRPDCSPEGELVRYQTSDVRRSSRDCAGPLLFLVYINDLPQCVTSSHTRLFTDNCLIYKEIRSQADADKLQVDLDALQGTAVFIRRNASCCESPERNLQWRRPTRYMDTHLLKLTLRNTLVYPSINTHLGPHTLMPQPRRPMELEPSSSATYARRQL